MTKVAPVRFASLMMGVWFLSNAAANKIAGTIAAFTPSPGEAPAAIDRHRRHIQHLSATNAGFWMIFVVIGFGAAGPMLLCVPLLNRLTASVKA